MPAFLATAGKMALGAAKGAAKKIATDKLLNRKKKTDARRATAQKIMGSEQDGEEKGGAIIVRPTTSLVQSPAGAIQKYTGGDQQQSGGGENLQGLVLRIKTSVISVESLLGNSVALQKKKLDDERKAREAEELAKSEKELEKKKPKTASKGLKLNLPGKGLISTVMDFITNVAFGWLAVRLVKFAPQIGKVLPFLGGVLDFVINVGGIILDGFITLVDWGYKLFEMGRGLVKNVFGEEGAKKFDTFMNSIKNLITGFLVWKIIGQKIFKTLVGNIKNTFNVIKGIFSKAGKVLNFLTGGRAGNLAKNVLGKGANLAKNVGGKLLNVGKNLIGKGGKALGGVAKGAKSIMKKGVGKAAKRAVIKMFGKTAGKIFGKIPIIGPVIVGIVSLLSGEPIGQALFKTFGAAIGGLLGTFIPIPVVGTLLGEAIGVFVGDLLYHLIVKRDPKAAFRMLKDTIMGIFKGGKAVFDWFAGGFSRFYQGIPKLKIPDFPKDPPKWIPGWVPRKEALWKVLTGGIKLMIGPLSLLMGKEIPILPWLIDPANTVPLLIKSFFPPGGSESGGGSISPMSSGGGNKSEESKKEEGKAKKEKEKAKKEEEKEKKKEEMKAKIGEVKSKVGGFFGKIGEGIKNVGGAIISKHPAVMAAKAVKGKITSSSKPSSSGKVSSSSSEIKGDLKTITFDGKTVPRGLSGPVGETFGGKGGSTYKAPTINKPNNSFGNMINSVSKKTEYEELEPVIITVPILVKSGGGVINQQSSSTTVASTGGESGNDPFEVLDFQG